MGYHSERRREYQGFAELTIPVTAKDRLAAALRDVDHVYERGAMLRVTAPVHAEAGKDTLVRRIRDLGVPVEGEFVPKELKRVAGMLDVDLRTGIGYLHSKTPLDADGITRELAALSPTMLRGVEAIYVESNEQQDYFTARLDEGTVQLVGRIKHGPKEHIPVRGAVHDGFIVCPVRQGAMPRYHSLTKTLSIKTSEQ